MSALDEIVKGLIGEYDAGNLEDASLAPVIKRIREGKATYSDVERLASRTGTRAGQLIAAQLAELAVDGRVTEEQARALLMGMTRHNYDIVSGAAADVQESLNQRAGLGLKAVRPEFNRDRVEGLITEVVGKEDVPAFGKTLTQQVENVSMATVDDSVKVNANAHYNAGLSPKIHRVTDGNCCKWCDSLAGVYDYDDARYTDVFRRHANCGCQVLYDPGDGKKWQDVHTKRLLSAGERAKIEARIRAMASTQNLPTFTGQSLVGYDPTSKRQIQSLLDKAPKEIRDIYDKYGGQLREVDEYVKPGYTAYFDPNDGRVHMHKIDAISGNGFSNPFQVHFHEYAHNIDYLAGGGTPFSETYKNAAGESFAEVINKDWERAMRDFFRDTAGDAGSVYQKAFDAAIVNGQQDTFMWDMLRNWRQTSGIPRTDPNYIALRDELQSIHGKKRLRVFYTKHFDVFGDLVYDRKETINAFIDYVNANYSEIERADLSDIFEPFSVKYAGKDYPFKVGHGASYWSSTGIEQSSEAFANMSDSIIANQDSLSLIRQFIPNAYQEYLVMLKEMAK